LIGGLRRRSKSRRRYLGDRRGEDHDETLHVGLGDRERRHQHDHVPSFADWSPWFSHLPWDATRALIDLRRNQVILLCVTDTD
jgi:hypothetical protein